MGQVDPAAFPQVQWNWQKNLDAALKTYNAKRSVALAWPGQEQKRLTERRKQQIALANRNRPIDDQLTDKDVENVTVPQPPAQAVDDDTIRLYNSGHDGYFDADYVLSADGKNVVNAVGSRQWKLSTPGKWDTNPTPPTSRRSWDPSANPGYVHMVKACTPA